MKRTSTSMRLPLTTLALAALAGCAETPTREALVGASPLVAMMNAAAAEHDVPSELLGALAWSETALRDHSKHWADEAEHDGAHGPRSAGVMGLPEHGAVRSVARGAALLGVSEEAVVFDAATNVRAAAAILRDLADRAYGPGVLGARGERERWLLVAERYFDAGAAGEKLVREVRRTIARGLDTFDDGGLAFRIKSFAELYALELPADRLGRSTRAVVGEYPASTWVAASSSNYTNGSRTAADIDVVIVHTTQGSYSGAISWFQNPAASVSAHYVVRSSDGDVTQMVHHADIAWHAGNWSYNERSIGIEHEGFVADASWYTDAMYRSSADLTRWLCDNLGIPKDRSHVIGHVEVPGATHTDPGPHWDWTRYMDLVNGGGGNPTPGNGTLKGVVYVAGDTANRIGGATVTVAPGGASVTVPADGYFEISLPAGDYTITASAQGYADNSVMRTVTSGADVWGSIGLTAGQATGIYRGVVYDARGADLSTRIPGATVRLSNGESTVVGDDGVFIFTVPPGDYTATAELMGWETGSTMRTVVAGQTAWGSIGLVPADVMPANRAPAVPTAESPNGGVSVVSVTPVFTVGALTDPEGDALRLEVEVYADAARTARVSSVNVAVPTAASLVSWRHPGQDLPRGSTLFWRVRALDASGAASPWSEPESFVTPDDGSTVEPSGMAWTAEVLAGVGTDQAPGAPKIAVPVAGAVLEVARPEIIAGPASDPEGDELGYQFQISTDDLFERVTAQSDLVRGGGAETRWTASRALEAGARYYVRVRAADERLFGPWSASVPFSVSANATSGEDVTATVTGEDGGCTTAGRPDAWGLALAVLGLVALRRRR